MAANVPLVPQHIGLILDGNRRWGRARGKDEQASHDAGYQTLQNVLQEALDQGVRYVSVYAFSTENWQRSQREVAHLMQLAVKAVTTGLPKFVRQQVRIRFLGRQDGLSTIVRKAIAKAEAATQHFTRATLAICFNYGGQQEIVDAVKAIIQQGTKAESVTPQTIADHLYAPDIPPVDIIVRTSGEQRLSNFMLWRASYSELYFVQKHWPDMTKQDVADIIKEYQRRSRRFGV